MVFCITHAFAGEITLAMALKLAGEITPTRVTSRLITNTNKG